MADGFHHSLLRVDLSTRTAAVEPLAEVDLRRFVGGAGLGAEILRRELPGKTDPFSPQNRLIFACGPFQGLPIPGAAKFSMVSISPLTGTFADTAAGADFGCALKQAGYDLLIVQGETENPVYLLIDDDRVEIKDAAGIWGKDAYETVDAVKAAEGRCSVAAIGPAGENRVAIACVVVDKHSFAGRCGLGAVMGAKNLKAVAVRGTRAPAVARPEVLTRLIKETSAQLAATAKENGFREHGTPGLCETAEALGDMPIKYWTGDTWPEGAKRLGAPNSTIELKARPKPCRFCPLGCHREIQVDDPEYAVTGAGPEYETMGLMGSNLLIDEPKVVAKGNDLANRLGLDSMSAGAMVGFCMEQWEKGRIGRELAGDLDLTWGNPRALLDLLPLIAHRKGLGALFADGTLRAAERLHPAAPADVVHVKGLDMPSHDPRACISLVPTYLTCTRGACHFRGGCEDIEMGGFFIPEAGITEGTVKFFEAPNQSRIAAVSQDLFGLFNSLVICAFMVDGGGMSLTRLGEIFNAVTGWDWTPDDLLLAGERGFMVQRLLNLRDGCPAHDTLPAKMFVPAKEGFRAGRVIPQEELMRDYYAVRGWDAQGLPTVACLERLELHP